jgi:hypothetical protein
MNKAQKRGLKKRKFKPDLEIDEDIELDFESDFDNELNQVKHNRNALSQRRITMTPKFPKSFLAGIFLLVAFFLSLFFPITYMLQVYDIETATGDTTLRGKVLGSNGKPIENVTVDIKDLNITTKTDDKGKYYFDKIPVGEHEIEYTKPGYRKIIVEKVLFSKNLLKQINEKDNVINIPGNLTSGIQIDAFKGPFMESYIIDDNYNRTIFGIVRNNSGMELVGADLAIIENNISSITDENARFDFYNITPGILTIKISRPGNDNITTYTFLFADLNSMNLNLTYFENKNRYINLETKKIGSINGSITTKKGDPIGNSVVTLQPQLGINQSGLENIEIKKSTKKDGSFQFDDIPVGIYSITISSDDFYLIEVYNITVRNNSRSMLPIFTFKKIKEPIKIIEEISSPYTYACIAILFILALITLIGAISAFQRKRYSLAFIGALTGMLPAVIALQINVCGASLVSLIALILIVFSRNEFDFK